MPEKKTVVPENVMRRLQNATRQQERFGQFSDQADDKVAIADFLNLTLFYFKLYTVDAPEILIHYESSKILSKNKNRTAPGNRTLFFTRVSKDPVLNKNEVHIRNINVQIYTNKFL